MTKSDPFGFDIRVTSDKKKRTRGTNRVGSKPATKRAIVTLAAGEIPLFEN